MKQLRYVTGMAGIIILFVIILTVGCMRWFERIDPTKPSMVAPSETIPSISGASPLNFYSGRARSDEFGVYAQVGQFVVQAPAGDYLLGYQTQSGGYLVAFRAEASALVYIGLQPGETVINSAILPGVITEIPADAIRSGAVTLCAWPEGSTNALAIFQSSALNELADYIKTLL